MGFCVFVPAISTCSSDIDPGYIDCSESSQRNKHEVTRVVLYGYTGVLQMKQACGL